MAKLRDASIASVPLERRVRALLTTKKGRNVKTKEEREREFLIGLAKLTRETGITIGGCGCCGSPALDEASDAELSDPDAGYGYGYADEVSWISHADNYKWKNFSDSIVRSNALAQADAACSVSPGAMGYGYGNYGERHAD